MTANDVRALQHCQAVPGASVVLPILPLVRRKVDSALGHLGDRTNRLPRSKASRAGRLDGAWAFGDTVARIGAWSACLGPCAVRAADIDETPLSPEEALIAMRDFANEVSP